jgi:hypothetical protein
MLQLTSNMKKYTISIYMTVDAENEEEALKIGNEIDITPEYKQENVYWESISVEVDEEKDE